MSEATGAGAIDAYIAGFPPASRDALERVRALVREAAPEATETISYGIPTFDLAGMHLVHFAGWKRHVGLYPTPGGMAEFETELAPYRRGRGSARFPLDEPLPAALIQRIVRFRVEEVAEKAARSHPRETPVG